MKNEGAQYSMRTLNGFIGNKSVDFLLNFVLIF